MKKTGRVITITGGAGRRDESTRYERGLIAGRGSEIFIVTEDDSRDENPEEIAAEFVRGAKEAGMIEIDKARVLAAIEGGERASEGAEGEMAGERRARRKLDGEKLSGKKLVMVEIDRRKAIRLALSLARKGDVVLILGKGHEKTILRAGGAEPFEDLKVAREELRKKGFLAGSGED